MSDPGAGAGRTYDAVPYDGGAQAGLSLAQVRGAAAALGFAPTAGPVLDVLDVGCGVGSQLFQAAQHSAGRMVGIDASEAACAEARARGAGLGARWQILHGDAATIDAGGLDAGGLDAGGLDRGALGQFDVIYVIGTLYIVPALARARMLARLAGCLKPGGVVVMNYYAGLAGLARTRLGRLLHVQNDPAWPVAQQVAMARANLQSITDAVPAGGVTREIVLATLAGMGGSSDTVLFHEALGRVFDTLITADIEAVLAPEGVSFLNYIPPAPVRAGAESRAAAQAADAWDFATGGGYRVALFGRGGLAGEGVRHPGLVWTTTLEAAAPQDGVACFADPRRGVGIRTGDLALQAAVECLIAAPRDWAGLGAAVRTWLLLRGLAVPEFDAAVAQLLMLLWRGMVARPALA